MLNFAAEEDALGNMQLSESQAIFVPLDTYCAEMGPREWLKRDYGLDIEPGGAVDGAALEGMLYRALVASGRGYEEQRRVLYECSGRWHDLAFGEACLDRIEAIERFERRRGAVRVPKLRRCDSGVRKNKEWGPGAEYADLRFEAARRVEGDLLDAIDDMVMRMAEAGYVEGREGLQRDLRQGLGYYREGEDLFRPRRTVKWLKGLNALHCWVVALLEEPGALSRVGEGAAGRWVTASSLFVDREGKAFTYSRLEHGVMRNQGQLEWLRRTVPRAVGGSEGSRSVLGRSKYEGDT